MRILLLASVLCNILLRVFAFKCKKCLTLTDHRCEEVDCFSPESCVSVLSYADDVKYTERMCTYTEQCGMSLNTGSVKQSVFCCRTDLCNVHTMPESPNDMQCYGCIGPECASDVKLIRCTANQRFCASGYFKGTYQSPANKISSSFLSNTSIMLRDDTNTFPFRGCASVKVCGAPFLAIDTIDCCCGQQCNTGTSTQHSVLLLLLPGLLSAFNVVM